MEGNHEEKNYYHISNNMYNITCVSYSKRNNFSHQKIAIAKEAAKLIKDNQTIILVTSKSNLQTPNIFIPIMNLLRVRELEG